MDQERETAAAARLLPPQLLNMEAGLLREGDREGFVSRAAARDFFRLEPARTLKACPVPRTGLGVLSDVMLQRVVNSVCTGELHFRSLILHLKSQRTHESYIRGTWAGTFVQICWQAPSRECCLGSRVQW